jgi:hypothetical protein
MGTNVLQVCDDEPGRDGSGRRTSRLTVRGESATPNFSSSSAAIRSSPQVRFARAMQGAQMESGSCGEQVLVVLSWQDTSGGWPLMVTINGTMDWGRKRRGSAMRGAATWALQS